MLSARAYSFRQKSRLAISLSWIGGFTNVVAFLVCGVVASHVTGNVTHMGRLLVQREHAEAMFMAFLWLMFFSGAVASAVLTEIARRRAVASKFIVPMALEAILLTLFAITIHVHPITDSQAMRPIFYWIGGLAAFAMGLQNATITKISGAVIRTTHLTGVTTDLGIETVQYLMWYRDLVRGRRWSRTLRVLKISPRHPAFQRVMLLASIIGSFVIGAIAGTWLYLYSGYPSVSLMVPVSFLGWIIFVDWWTPIADVKELDWIGDAELRQFGILKSHLPPEVGIWRVSCRRVGKWHKAPDFQVWADKVPARFRVIILALSTLTRFDRNAVLDLEAALDKLNAQGRKLVLSGIMPAQYQNLMELGIGRSVEVENLCSDLEFAVARGIDLMEALHPQEGDGSDSETVKLVG